MLLQFDVWCCVDCRQWKKSLDWSLSRLRNSTAAVMPTVLRIPLETPHPPTAHQNFMLVLAAPWLFSWYFCTGVLASSEDLCVPHFIKSGIVHWFWSVFVRHTKQASEVQYMSNMHIKLTAYWQTTQSTLRAKMMLSAQGLCSVGHNLIIIIIIIIITLANVCYGNLIT